MKEKKRVTTIRLQNLSYGHKQAATFMAAVKLDLFTHISNEAGYGASSTVWRNSTATQ